MTDMMNCAVDAMFECLHDCNQHCDVYAGESVDGRATIDGLVNMRAVLRAALVAIREPSDAMTDAGSVLVDTYFPDSGDNSAQTAHEAWQAMIDAALNECAE